VVGRARRALGLRRVAPDDQLTVVEHLDELRRRILISVVALVVGFTVAWILRNPIVDLLLEPLPDGQDRPITLSPTEPFFTVLKVCLWSAILFALPVWLFQLYAFVIPAVGNQSRRVMLAIVAGVSALFIGGVAFGYFVVLPVALEFLLNFGDDIFTTEVQAGLYFGFATTLLLASGLMFEVPVAMVAFARMGLVTAQIYRKQWRIAVVAIAAIAAVLPGGDPLSMFLLMVPQFFLYALGIWLSSIFGRPPVWQGDAWTLPDDERSDDDSVT
jgi:sec-independent protein translocase protein TatC